MAASILFLGGCSGPAGPVCHPVHGQVKFNGRALAEALVVFHPQDGGAAGTPKPFAQTDALGNFCLSTHRAGDGAPTGDYAITVELRDLRQVGEELVRDGKNLLPPQFASPEQSGLRHTVVQGENAVPPLEIFSR
jgi:hypothetical protein